MRNAKKIYTKPIIEEIRIDTDISIVMMTTPPPDPDSKIINQDWEKEKAKENERRKSSGFNSPFE